MTWLSSNWFLVVAGIAFVAFHFFGHRGHGGGHGGHTGHSEAPPALLPAVGQTTLPQSGPNPASLLTDPATTDEPPAKQHSHGGTHC